MKKIAILLSICLLAGCTNAIQQPMQENDFSAEAVYEAEITTAPEKTDETEQTPLPKYSTAKAVDHLYRCIAGTKRPDNFAGTHTVDGTLMIMITDNDETPYDFMSEFDCIAFEQVEYSLNELEDLFESGIPQEILREHNIDLVLSGVDCSKNAVKIEVFDKYTDEEKAEISSYVEDYPVVIEYVSSYQIAV